MLIMLYARSSVAFYGDLIVSRARDENCIKIWRIHGFNTPAAISKATPDKAAAQLPGHAQTRSAFGKGFALLLILDCVNTHEWFLRFDMFLGPCGRPTLAMGNVTSEIFFWDLQDIEEGKLSRVDDGDGGVVLGGAFTSVMPQTRIVPGGAPKDNLTWTNVAWSTDGEWCVAVGLGAMAVMRRLHPTR